jgi:two-component system NtrC family sensor kinase
VTVRVEPGPFRPTANAHASDQPAARVSIEDQGIGIPAENLDHIFDPFFTTKEVGKGTGLGLSIAYGIVQDHGGWIEVSSQPGEGSRFLIYLPLAETRCIGETSTDAGSNGAARRSPSFESRPIEAASPHAAPSS